MNVAEKEERGSEVEVQRQEGRGWEGEATGGTSLSLSDVTGDEQD